MVVCTDDVTSTCKALGKEGNAKANRIDPSRQGLKAIAYVTWLTPQLNRSYTVQV